MAFHVSFWTPSTYYILWALWLISELFQLPKYVYANFCFKVFRMPRIVVVFSKKRTIFSKSSFVSYSKIIFVFEIVHCAVFLLWFEASEAFTLGKGRIHFFSFKFINVNATNHLISIISQIFTNFFWFHYFKVAHISI